MASNIALRRFKKANRRKAVVAERRQAQALEATLPNQIRRAAAGPIHHCLVSEELFNAGMGTLVVMRGPPGEIVMSTFLLDVFCLGIKDIHVRPVTIDDMEYFVDALDAAAPIKAVEPAYARKLLRELATWAESIGFPAHRDFPVAARLLGDVDADASDAIFRFGLDGKPYYVPGPSETPSQIHHRLDQLRKRLGDGGFKFMVATEDDTWDVAVELESGPADVPAAIGASPPS